MNDVVAPGAEGPARVVLYDGECGLCDRSVQWILSHDPDGRFSFAPLQGDAAATLRERHPAIPTNLSSMAAGRSGRGRGRARPRSFARRLSDPRGAPPTRPRSLRWLRYFRLLPAFLTDLGYRFIAAIRYRVWGTADQCRIPSPEERARFLA